MAAETWRRSLARPSTRTVAAGIVAAACVLGASDAHARCRAQRPARCLKAGAIDPTFGVGEQPVFYDLGDGSSRGAMDMAVQPDGRIVMGGSSSLDGGSNHDATLARFTAQGLPDTTFGTGGVQRLDLGPGNAIVQSVALQADGKILAAGGHDADPSHQPGQTTGYVPRTSFLARFDVDGSLDPSFGAGGKVVVSGAGLYRGYQRVLVQGDGKILAIGLEAGRLFVERYDAGGGLDPTFGSAGVAMALGSGFHGWTPYYRAGAVLQGDGKILIAGTAFGVGEHINCALARFDSSGALDPALGGGERLVPQQPADVCNLQAVVQQADGKILASGAFYTAGSRQAFALMRFAADGSLDTSFGKGGRVLTVVDKRPTTITSHALALQPDGFVLQAGSDGGAVLDVTRHRPNGRRDSKFRGDGDAPGVVRVGDPHAVQTAVFDGAQAVVVLPEGGILVGGNPGHQGSFALVRLVAKPCLYDPRGPTLVCE